MTKAQQDTNIASSIAQLRQVLAEIETSQNAGDDLLTMKLAEQLQEHGKSILWSASANAHEMEGTSWAVIGGRLGVTRQAGHQRFAGKTAS
jgi:hypothetical protein